MSRPIEYQTVTLRRDVPRFEPSMLLQIVAVKVHPGATAAASAVKAGVVFHVGRLLSYTSSATRTTFILEGDHSASAARVALDLTHHFLVDTVEPWSEPSDELQEKSA